MVMAIHLDLELLPNLYSCPRTFSGQSHPTEISIPLRKVPIRHCFWWGLPCERCYHLPGGLLPHPFTLTCITGGLFSVALSIGLPRPGVTWHHCFVKPGLSSHSSKEPATIRPSARPSALSCSTWVVKFILRTKSRYQSMIRLTERPLYMSGSVTLSKGLFHQRGSL